MRRPANATDDEAARAGSIELENELSRMRGQLRTTVEQYETQNEELKASNEELQAINEELRSATEELETSKEELQSINEELATVNQELKSKVEETASVNNDLQNFIASTNISVLFVDRRLQLMRFTPPVRELFNVIPSDVGRPLLDITHRLDYTALERDVASVFETLRTVEREVRDAGGRWFLMRILPYRTSEDRIDGAVLTFVDISARKETRRAAAAEPPALPGDARKHSRLRDCHRRPCRPHRWLERGRSADVRLRARPRSSASRWTSCSCPRTARPARLRAKCATAREHGHAADERWHLRKDGTPVLLQRRPVAAVRRRDLRLRQGGARSHAAAAGARSSANSNSSAPRPIASSSSTRTGSRTAFSRRCRTSCAIRSTSS